MDTNIFAIGDTINVGDFKITVIGYRRSERELSFTIGEGNEVYFIDVVIANRGDKAKNFESISRMFGFRLRGEGFSRVAPHAVATTLAFHGGSILPGKVIRGELGYEIPRGSRNNALQIHLEGSTEIFSVNMNRVSETPPNPDALHSLVTGAEFAIGESVKIGDIEFIVNGTRRIRTEPGSAFTGYAGGTYLLVDVAITNHGDETELITAITAYRMLVLRDTRGFLYHGGMRLDDVMPGSTLRGEARFRVPEAVTDLELFVRPNLFRVQDIFVVSLD